MPVLPRHAPVWLVAALGTLLLAVLWHAPTIDDAYITFRYARNLARHGELVFNPGEAVEGTTNLLWALICTPAALIQVSMETWALVAAIACLVWTSVRLTHVGRLMGAGPVATLAAVGLCVTNLHFLRATTNGLEGAFYAALMLEALFQILRGRLKLAALFAGLMFLTRPEGAALAGLAGLLAWRLHGRGRGRDLLAGVAVLAVIVGAVTIWRLATYGDPVPNSVIAKSFGFAELRAARFGAPYFLAWASEAPHLLLLLALAGVLLLREWRSRDPATLAALFAAAGLGFSYAVTLRNAGDWMPHFRLLAQYLPLYAVLLLWLASPPGRARLGRPKLAAPGAALVLLFQAQQLVFAFGTSPDDSNRGFLDLYAQAAERLKGRLKPTDVVSAEGLGYIAWALEETPFHDPLGLTDKHLARHGRPEPTYGKEDVNYSVGTVRPAVLLWNHAGHLRPLRPELAAEYEIRCHSDCDTGWNARLAMLRRDRAAELRPAFADWPELKLGPDGPGPVPSP